MLQRFRLDMEYDGTDFCGWQRQRAERTVQQELEKALAELNHGQPVTLIGSGRTDAGVHALGQVAHFDLDTYLAAVILRNALNAKTGPDIYVRDCRAVATDFHARFGARRRTYLYKICLNRAVLERRTSWQPKNDFNEILLHECAACLPGEHDFTRLSRVAAEPESKICTIYDSKWINTDNFLNYTIVGNRFLHSMVRMLVGTMTVVARGKGRVADFKTLVENQASELRAVTAPPQGLVLQRVEY